MRALTVYKFSRITGLTSCKLVIVDFGVIGNVGRKELGGNRSCRAERSPMASNSAGSCADVTPCIESSKSLMMPRASITLPKGCWFKVLIAQFAAEAFDTTVLPPVFSSVWAASVIRQATSRSRS